MHDLRDVGVDRAFCRKEVLVYTFSIVKVTVASLRSSLRTPWFLDCLPIGLLVSGLARSAKLPTGLYILLISGSAGPNFAIFSPNVSVLDADD